MRDSTFKMTNKRFKSRINESESALIPVSPLYFEHAFLNNVVTQPRVAIPDYFIYKLPQVVIPQTVPGKYQRFSLSPFQQL